MRLTRESLEGILQEKDVKSNMKETWLENFFLKLTLVAIFQSLDQFNSLFKFLFTRFFSHFYHELRHIIGEARISTVVLEN